MAITPGLLRWTASMDLFSWNTIGSAISDICLAHSCGWTIDHGWLIHVERTISFDDALERRRTRSEVKRAFLSCHKEVLSEHGVYRWYEEKSRPVWRLIKKNLSAQACFTVARINKKVDSAFLSPVCGSEFSRWFLVEWSELDHFLVIP